MQTVEAIHRDVHGSETGRTKMNRTAIDTPWVGDALTYQDGNLIESITVKFATGDSMEYRKA